MSLTIDEKKPSPRLECSCECRRSVWFTLKSDDGDGKATYIGECPEHGVLELRLEPIGPTESSS